VYANRCNVLWRVGDQGAACIWRDVSIGLKMDSSFRDALPLELSVDE